MQFHAEQNSNIEFIHEGYGENKISTVLESVMTYRETPEYSRLKEKQQKLEEIKERRAGFNATWTMFCLIVFVFCFGIPFFSSSLIFLMGIGLLMPFMWFFILIIGNRRYSNEEQRVSKELS
jgi:ABC-type bacteriocin/lantibiotic exporter with double-glycine peptidase domain